MMYAGPVILHQTQKGLYILSLQLLMSTLLSLRRAVETSPRGLWREPGLKCALGKIQPKRVGSPRSSSGGGGVKSQTRVRRQFCLRNPALPGLLGAELFSRGRPEFSVIPRSQVKLRDSSQAHPRAPWAGFPVPWT